MNQNPNIVSRQNEIAAARAKLAAELAALANEETQLVEQATNELTVKIDGLPAQFEMTSLDEVVAAIRARQKGTLGKLSTTAATDAVRSRTVLSEEQKTKLVEEFKAGGPSNQRSVLCERYNISSGTLQNILKDAGLTKVRETV